MTDDEIQYGEESKRNLNDQRQDRLERENNPLPENVSEYVQKARDELKQYEEQKKFYEKRRKKEIVLGLVDLLEQYDYPKEWLRLIIAQELGDYISTNYIERILADRYPANKKKVKEESTRQTDEIHQIDDRTPIEVSSTGESIIGSKDGDPNDTNSYPHDSESSIRTKGVPTEFKTELEQQAEEGVREIVKTLQRQNKELKTRCYQLDQLAQEASMWKEKYTQLQQEFDPYRNKIIKGNTQIEFGSEFLPVRIEYNFRTNQFSARIPEEVINRILGALRRRGGEIT